MKIVLVRHGEAEPLRTVDAERALTANGLAQARLTAAWLQQQIAESGGTLKLLASPYRRAQQTAAMLANALGVTVQTLAEVTPDVDPRNALRALDSAGVDSEWLVVVSHMPLVAALARWLEEGTLGSGQGFMLSEARILEAEAPGPGTAILRSHFIPGVSH